MRSEYLDKFVITLPVNIREQLEAIYAPSGETLSEEMLDHLVQELMSERTTSMFVPDKQVGIVKSSAHNNNIKNIRFDLNHLFMAVERMDAVVRDHYRLQQSALRDIKARLDRVNLQLEAARIMGPDKYRSIWHESFDNYSRQQRHYSKSIPQCLLCYETATGELTLPLVTEHKRSIGATGIPTIKSSILCRHEYALTVPGHDLAKAFDMLDDTFFAEVVVCDEPLINTNIEMDSETIVYPGVVFGLLMEFYMPESMNMLRLAPQCGYGMDLLGICIIDVSGQREWIGLLQPDHLVSFAEPMLVYFDRRQVQAIEIYVGQRNYLQATYRVQRAYGKEYWTKIALDSNDEYTDFVDFDHACEDSLQYWTHKLQQSFMQPDEARALAEIVSGLPDETATQIINAATNALEQYEKYMQLNRDNTPINYTSKVEYQYGIASLVASDTTYWSEGEWVSSPIAIEDYAYALKLNTNVTMPIVDIEQIDGTIEPVPLAALTWSFNMHANTSERWIPILPENSAYVECEYLRVDAGGGAIVKYPIDEIEWIRGNGVRLAPSVYKWSHGNNKIQINNYRPGVLYAISYKPLYSVKHDPHIIYPGQDTPLVAAHDEFTNIGEDQQLNLTFVPFIDYSQANREEFDPNASGSRIISLTLDGNLSSIGYPVMPGVPQGVATMDSDPPIRNMTNYRRRTGEAMLTFNTFAPDDTERAIHFVHHNNRLFFAEPIPARAIVEYETAITEMRLRVQIRKIVPGYTWLTPRVHGAIVKAKIFA